MPQRLQRSRRRGWRKPPGAVYVGRGTRWGNPFPLTEYSRSESLRLFRQQLDELPANELETLLAPLRGKDVLCWCSPEVECHADIWLELANWSTTHR